MEEFGVGAPVARPSDGTNVWSTRWCFRPKGDMVRARFAVRQFREPGVDHCVRAGTLGPETTRSILILAALRGHFVGVGDFSVAFAYPAGRGHLRLGAGGGGVAAAPGVEAVARALRFVDRGGGLPALPRAVARRVGFPHRPHHAMGLSPPSTPTIPSWPGWTPRRGASSSSSRGASRWRRWRISRWPPTCATSAGSIAGPAGASWMPSPRATSRRQRARSGSTARRPQSRQARSRSSLWRPTSGRWGPEWHHAYRATVGRIHWGLRSWPDALYAVQEVSKQLQAPTAGDFIAAKRVAKLLAGTGSMGLFLQPKAGPLEFVRFSDSDWAACHAARRSRSGVIIMPNGALVSAIRWSQSVVSLSVSDEVYNVWSLALQETAPPQVARRLRPPSSSGPTAAALWHMTSRQGPG